MKKRLVLLLVTARQLQRYWQDVGVKIPVHLIMGRNRQRSKDRE